MQKALAYISSDIEENRRRRHAPQEILSSCTAARIHTSLGHYENAASVLKITKSRLDNHSPLTSTPYTTLFPRGYVQYNLSSGILALAQSDFEAASIFFEQARSWKYSDTAFKSWGAGDMMDIELGRAGVALSVGHPDDALLMLV